MPHRVSAARVNLHSRGHCSAARLAFPAFCPCWGVVQLVGHLTVNEDGEGSNPSAPAKFSLRICTPVFHLVFGPFSHSVQGCRTAAVIPSPQGPRIFAGSAQALSSPAFIYVFTRCI